jgi:cold shock protein
MKGTVKFFNQMKGFGFVTGEDGKEYFVHITGISEGVTLRENDAVTFDVEDGDRGPKATNINLDSGDSAEEAPAEEAAEEEAPAEEEKPEEQ